MDAVVQWQWLRLPLLTARLWPGAGVALSDGHYVTRWPVAAVTTVPGCVLLGFLLGALHGAPIYTYSLLLMLLLGAVGQLGAVFGLWMTVGFAAGDLLFGEPVVPRFMITNPVAQVWLPALLSYVLLGLLTVLAPVLVRGIRALVVGVRRVPAALLRVAEPVAAAIAAAVAGWAWVQTIPLLIRPVFTWLGRSPTVDAIAPLQERGGWLVAVVTAVAVGRVFLERYALTGRAATLAGILWAGLHQEIAKGPRRGTAGHVLTAAGALGATLLLSGLIHSFLVGVAVLAFFTGLLLLRRYLIFRAAPLVRAVAKVPFVLRLGAGMLGGYFISQIVVSFFWTRTQTFLPVLAGACAAIALIMLLTLPAPGEQQTGPHSRTRTGVVS